MKKMKISCVALLLTTISTVAASAQSTVDAITDRTSSRQAATAKFEAVKHNHPQLTAFLKAFPKGGDIHNHLVGAIYAENYLDWAAEDGLCIDPVGFGIVVPKEGTACEISAKQALISGPVREKAINALSMRNFQPSNGWSGHNQFFSTFDKMYYANFYQYGDGPLRSGDMLAEAAVRASDQNLAYLELLHTMELGSILSMVPANFGEKEQTIEGLYNALMRGPFGKSLPQLVSNARAHLDLANIRKNELLNCENVSTACEVKILFLHQVIREFSLPQVFAQLILGAELSRMDHRMVGLNMVAPEDGANAMADYSRHMQMIGFLWNKEKIAGTELNVTLHAGELALGLVTPEGLGHHISQAIEIAKAKRIGHGIDIAYEKNLNQLLSEMAENQIMVEINLTSNETILGVSGSDHPFALYKQAGVPMALSTDDEGVSRIDITNEYSKAVLEQGASYEDLIALSRNSLIFSFIPGESLWDKNKITHEGCKIDIEANKKSPSPACLAFLNSSAKAAVQWHHEMSINEFEGNLVSYSSVR